MSELSRSEIIGRFGGARALSEKLEIPESTVRNWPGLGIPGRWHLPLLKLAGEMGVALTADELLSTTNRTAA